MKNSIKELKQQWLKAKVKAGDYRGLKANRFNTDTNPMEVIFYSLSKNEEKRELEMEIEETGEYNWNWKDFIKNVKEAKETTLNINFSVNIWKKHDRENKHLFSYTFHK